MIAGMLTGLVSAVVLIVLSPAVMGVDAPGTAARHLMQRAPIFPLDNPALVSVPLGFIAAIAGTLLGRDPDAVAAYSELNVRANTGIGAV
jgi:cation/acetate symporter